MFIRNVKASENAGKRVLVELRIGLGHGHFSDIRHKTDINSSQQLGKLFELSVGMTDGEEWRLHISSRVIEGAALVRRDMIGLVAFDLVLGIIFGGVMRMAFVVKISGVDGDDAPRHPACLGIPAYVIADLESPSHLVDSLFLIEAFLSIRSRKLPLVTPHLFATAPPSSRYRGQAASGTSCSPKAGNQCARASLTRGGALAAGAAMEVLGGEDMLATRLELFRAAKSGTPPVGIGNGELTT
jgi:hypothetical protein